MRERRQRQRHEIDDRKTVSILIGDAGAERQKKQRDRQRQEQHAHAARPAAPRNRASAQQHCAIKAQRVELKRKRKGQRRRAQIGFRRFKLFQTFTPVDIQRRFFLFGKARADKPCQIIAAYVKQQRILNERRDRQQAGWRSANRPILLNKLCAPPPWIPFDKRLSPDRTNPVDSDPPAGRK